MQNTTGKLMERIVARKLVQDFERKKILPPNQGYRAGKTTRENAAIFAYDVYEGFQSKKQTGHGGWSGRCVQQSVIQIADGTCAIWHQFDVHRMACSSTPKKKGCHATWKLDLHTPATDNGASTRLPPVPSPLQCLHKGTRRSEQQWFKPGAYTCGQQVYLQNSQWHQHISHCCPGAAGKGVTLVPRDRVRSQKQGASSVVHP